MGEDQKKNKDEKVIHVSFGYYRKLDKIFASGDEEIIHEVKSKIRKLYESVQDEKLKK